MKTKQPELWEKEFDEMWNGYFRQPTHIENIYKVLDSSKVKSFLRTQIKTAKAEERQRVVEIIKKDLNNMALVTAGGVFYIAEEADPYLEFKLLDSLKQK